MSSPADDHAPAAAPAPAGTPPGDGPATAAGLAEPPPPGGRGQLERARRPEPVPGRLFWSLIAVIIAADQVTKYAIRASLDLFESMTVIPGLADFTYVQNTGLAYGLFNTADVPFKRVITAGLAMLALGGIMYFARQVRQHERLARVGLSLILAGALGNLIDRFFLGYVVDFVDLYRGGWHFWAFNVADASITVGAICVFADLLLVKRHAPDSV